MSDEGDEKNGGHDFGFLRRKRERESAARGDSPDSTPGDTGGSPGGTTDGDSDRGNTSEPSADPGSAGSSGEGDPGSKEGESRDTQSSAEPGGSGGDVPKRGRHRRDCQCERCDRRRQAAGTETPGSAGTGEGDSAQGIPRKVSWDEVFQAFQPTAGRKPKPADAFAGFYSLTFDLIATAGYGEHWKIPKEDAKQLGQCTAACFDTIGGKARARAEAFLLKWAPWAALAGTATIIAYPRYQLTKQMIAMAREESERRQHGAAYPQDPGQGGSPSGGPANPGGSSDPYSKALHEQPFEDRRFRLDPSAN